MSPSNSWRSPLTLSFDISIMKDSGPSIFYAEITKSLEQTETHTRECYMQARSCPFNFFDYLLLDSEEDLNSKVLSAS